MAYTYYSASRGNGSTLYIAPLSQSAIDASGQDLQVLDGHYLFERRDNDPSAVVVLAHLASEDAAFEMTRLLPLNWS